jgi:hypothetical protein
MVMSKKKQESVAFPYRMDKERIRQLKILNDIRLDEIILRKSQCESYYPLFRNFFNHLNEICAAVNAGKLDASELYNIRNSKIHEFIKFHEVCDLISAEFDKCGGFEKWMGPGKPKSTA